MKKNSQQTIVLLHGWGHTKEHWKSLEEKFSKDFSTFSLDFPGFGKEPLVRNDWGIPEYSHWLIEEIQKMHLDNVILLGHSFGGRVAAYTASKRPNWLKGLILSGAPVLYRPSKSVQRKILVYKVVKRILPKSIRSLFINQEDLNARNKGMGKIRYNAITFDQSKYLPNILVPTLIINGSLDDQNPVKIAKEAHTLIPNSQLEIIKGGDHFIFEKNEYLFYGKVNNFIKSL